MRVHPKNWSENIWRKFISRIYLASLSLYPKIFKDSFGSEMNDVFREAFAEQAQKGPLHTIIFIGREMIEAPVCILNQHLEEKSFWVQPFPLNILAFTFGFILLGLHDVLKYALNLVWMQGWLINILCLIFIGAIVSLAIGSILNPRKKHLFALCGAIGFLLANTLVQQGYLRIFPDAFLAPGIGLGFLIPFLLPILIGSVFGLFIGAATGNWHGVFRWTVWGGLALFAGFIINRLSAALMQSYLFHSPTQDIVLMGIGGFLIPYLLEGMLLGFLFGGITKRRITVR